MAIPRMMNSKKTMSVSFAHWRNLPWKRSLVVLKLKDFRELISLSKIPVRKAIVPPLTPGMTFAAPIPIPLRVRSMYSFILLILRFPYMFLLCCQYMLHAFQVSGIFEVWMVLAALCGLAVDLR